MLLKSLKIWEESLGPENSNIGYVLNNLGFIYLQKGLLDEAENYLKKSLYLREKTLGFNSYEVSE